MSLPKIIKPFVQIQRCPKLPPHKGYNKKSMGWTSTDTSWTFQVIWFVFSDTSGRLKPKDKATLWGKIILTVQD